ncbi:MAG: hypothetical protein KKE62_05430 [Proteobacteria bacterium]|nr:hypothetical protein [Pseudomonadota bacterium]MBU1387051.1 hypothetical protein [Pseudomonadota bacterium]MBU1542268.1 hypothetical protein [Pseudomonadota bacterium]MBU2430845.1 hypothetical protein [Pseudomonadota bacterium]MBU2481511.1 hypothetical protein [Pseudomonadota bacterium]
MPTPAGLSGKERQKGVGVVEAVSFSHSRNSLLVLERGDEYDGIVDFGWEDPAGLVFEKPYLTLISGRLRVKNEASRIGIGFYFSVMRGSRKIVIPVSPVMLTEAWIQNHLKAAKARSRKIFSQAEALKKQNNYAVAELLYGQAKDLDPMNQNCYDYQAYCLDKSGRRSQGYPLLEASIRLKSQMYNNYLYGKFLSLDKRYKDAIMFLEISVAKLNPDSTFFFPFRELGGASLCWTSISRH